MVMVVSADAELGGSVVVDDEASRAASAGAPRWWSHLYARRYASTARLAGLLASDFSVGEEIAQEAFARLFEVRAVVRDPDRYLTGTVLNLCRAQRRARRRRQRQRADVAPEEVSDRGADEEVDDRLALAGALRRLPARQREAVVLRYWLGWSEAETAEAMGVSAGSVKTHVHRAVAALSSEREDLR